MQVWRAARSYGDINGDGFADLAFVQNGSGSELVRIVLGGSTKNTSDSQGNVIETSWDHFWGQTFVTASFSSPGVTSSFRKIDLSATQLSASLNLDVFDMTGDGFADVVVIAGSTDGASSLEVGVFEIGVVFSGQTLKIKSVLNLIDQVGNILSNSASPGIQTTVLNDQNGDGVDELLFGNVQLASELRSTYNSDSTFRYYSSRIATFNGTQKLDVVVNGIVQRIELSFDRKNAANNTIDKIVEQINTQIQTSSLAGLVVANKIVTNFEYVAFSIANGASDSNGIRMLVNGNSGEPIDVLPEFRTTSGTNNVTQAISDFQTTISEIFIGSSDLINSNIFVSVRYNHTYNADLTVTLIAPDGTRVQLFSGIGGSSDNFQSTLGDASNTSINQAGINLVNNSFYRPDQPLSVLKGKATYGNWKLEVVDNAAADQGTLLSWSLEFQTITSFSGGGSNISSPYQSMNVPFIASSRIPSLMSTNTPGDSASLSRFAVKINSFGNSSTEVLSLADLNNDGYGDFAFDTSSGLNVYYGSPSFTSATPTAKVILGMNLTAAAGDFDGDGKMDLAVTASDGSLPGVFIFHSIADLGTTLALSQADLVLPITFSRSSVPSQRSVNLKAFDLNADSIVDLVVTDSNANSESGSLSAGALYVIYGSYKRIELPTTSVSDLENFSVPGSGAFVVNPETGRSEVFTNAGKPFSTTAPVDEKWFRFTTLGDGKVGNAIRLIDVSPKPTQLRIAEVPINNPRSLAQNLELVNWTKIRDLNIEQSIVMPHVSIAGTGDGTYDYYSFTATAGSRGIFDIDKNNFDTELFLFDTIGNLLATDDDTQGPGADPGQGTGQASYIDHTFTSSGTFVIGVGKFNSGASGGEITGLAPAVGDVYFLNVSIQNHVSAPIADLIDANGEIIEANQSVFDLRNVLAGTYYLRVHDSTSQFTIDFDAPSRGQFAGTTTLPDRDYIDGGDGDDLLVGNNDIDRIFGGSGSDRISSEPIEQHDSTPGDSRFDVKLDERISHGIPSVVDPIVETGNAALNRAIASTIGRPLTVDVSGIPQIYGPVRASDLTSVSTLNASGHGIRSLDGLQQLANLQWLDLSSNSIASQDSSPFDGKYTILANSGEITLSFGSSRTITGIAIYNGYANRDDGNYVLKDAAGTFLGDWTVSNSLGGTNNGVDSFWLVFNTPVVTTGLKISATGYETGNTLSFREIEVFQNGPTSLTNVGPAAGHMQIGNNASFYLAAHQTESGSDQSSNPDVTGGRGGTSLTYITSGSVGAFPVAGFGAAQLNNGDISRVNFDKLAELKQLRSLDLSNNVGVTNIQPLSGLTKLQDLYLHGTGIQDLNAAATVISTLKLQTLTLPVAGLFPAAQNLTALEGSLVTLTTNVTGAWSVTNQLGTQIASGTGTTITFTPSGTGKYTVTHAATGAFPFFSQNVAPVISGTPQTVNLNEGDVRTADQLLTAAGLTIFDAGSTPPTRQVTVTDSSGVVTDLTTGSLAMNDDAILLDPAILDGASDVSVAFWMRTSATNAPGILTAASTISGTNPSGDNEFLIASSGGNRIIVYYKNAVRSFLSTTPFNNDTWHHFVVIRNDSNDTISVYVDGVQLGSAQSIPLGTLSVAANGFVVGQEQDSVGGGFDPTQALNGKLDELAIWRRVLTPAQITEIFSKGVVGTEADLAAYYPLNELGGDIATDRSSNSRNGVIRSIDTPTPSAWSTDSAISTQDFRPLNEGNFTLTVVARDLQGTSARAEAAIQVNNVAPTAVITRQTMGTLLAGQAVKFDAVASTDPGVNDERTYFWEVLFNGSPADFISSESSFEFKPVFAGSYEVKLTVTDSAGAVSLVSSIVAVHPSIAVVANQSGYEGDVFVFNSDGVSPKAANATREYAWRVLVAGNPISTGVAPTNVSTFAFAAPDNGTYSVELTITDTINSVLFSTTRVISTVVTSNVTPTIAFGATTFGTEGTQVTLSPAIFDAGSADTLTYLWAVTTVRNGNTLSVPLDSANNLANVRFTPADNGTYTATLIVTDKDGAATLPTSTTVIVANAAPIVEPASNRPYGGDLVFDEGTNQNLVFLRFYFSEVGLFDFDSAFTYRVDFGDGTQEERTDGRYSQDWWQVDHTYADSGVYIVTFTLIDKDGAAGTATRRVAINNFAPQNVTVSGPATVDEDTTVTFMGTAADSHNFIPGSPDNEPLRALVDFGDGTVLPTTLRPRLNLVAEVEPNNTYATGQDLETLSWSNAYNPATQYGQGPHVSVRGTGNGTNDWYRFFVEEVYSSVEISVREANFAAVLSLVNVATGTLTTGDLWSVRPDYILFGTREAAEFAIRVQRSDGVGGIMPLQSGDEYIIDFMVWGHEFATLPFEDLKNYDFTSRHVYAKPGTYNVTVTVQDDDGGKTTSSVRTVTIADTTPPTVSATPVTPNPRNTAVDSLVITFSESVQNFDLSDLKLTRNGGTDLLAGSSATLNHNLNGQWTLGNLASLTNTDGNYELVLSRAGSGIIDGVGLPLANDLRVQWSAFITAPVVTVDSLTTIDTRPRLTGTVDDRSATVAVTVNSISYPATNNGDGTWRLSANVIATLSPGVYNVSVAATNAFGTIGTDATSGELTISAPILMFRIGEPALSPSGFSLAFNSAPDFALLNLYDGVDSSVDLADVTLVGASVGAVRGSLAWDANTKLLHFIKTGGPLVADNYTVTVSSRVDGLRLATGEYLDGNNNGTVHDYVRTFSVAPSTARVVSLPDFSRGATSTAGQNVNLSFDNGNPGIPVTISDGTGVLAMDFDITYNPAMLSLSSTFFGVLPAGWSTTVNLVSTGRMRLSLSGSTPLPAGPQIVTRLLASVPANTPYGASDLVRIEGLSVFTQTGGNVPVSSKADAGLHKAIFVGDTNADGLYTAQDAGWTSGVLVGAYTGFDAYSLTDPSIVANVNQNAGLDGLDASWIARKGLSASLQTEIPNLPAGGLIIPAGIDPTIAADLLVPGRRGATANVPIRITDNAAGLFGVDVFIDYNTNILDLADGLNAAGVNFAGMFLAEGGWTVDSFVDDATGKLRIALYRASPSTSTAGVVANVPFAVKANATLGESSLIVSGNANVPPFTFSYVHGSVNVLNANEPVVLTRANANVTGNVQTQLINTGTWFDSESDAVTLTASVGAVTKNANGTWIWAFTPTVAISGQVVTISANDGSNVSSITFSVTAYTTIATRGIQYVGATGASASTSLATDKQALLPGQSSTFANYTNYSRGLNGIVIDVLGLPATVTSAQLAASLLFANWNGISAAGFVALSGAAVPTVSVVSGGVAGSTRVRITFPDNSVQNTWLRVMVLANSNTGLAANDIFYFGNVIGELNFGNTASRLRVNGQDAALMLTNQSPGANSAGVTNRFDLDRNGRVNGQDYAILLANQQAAGIVAPITVSATRIGTSSRQVANGGNRESEDQDQVKLESLDAFFKEVGMDLVDPAMPLA